MRAIAARLNTLSLDYAFVGGAVVNLLLDDPAFSPARPTDDVDVILEVVAQNHYAVIEERLRKLGFDHDMRPGAPRCRWILGRMVVDIMPANGEFLGLNPVWFKEALAGKTEFVVGEDSLPVISPVAFLATKYAAFCDRGARDYYGSHDLEDFVTVVDGREKIVEEIAQTEEALRRYIVEAVKNLMETSAFREALPGFFTNDESNRRRLPALRRKLQAIAAIEIT